jgi:hypothetical protein
MLLNRNLIKDKAMIWLFSNLNCNQYEANGKLIYIFQQRSSL